MKFTFATLIGAAVAALATPALAGMVPMPVAGAFGPAGLAAVAIVYGGYRAVKFYRARR